MMEFDDFGEEMQLTRDSRGMYSVDEALRAIGTGRVQWWLLFVVGMAWLSSGMHVVALAVIGPLIRCEWGLTNEEQVVLMSASFAGMFAGGALWGMMADNYGRKVSLLLASLLATWGVLGTFMARGFAAALVAQLWFGCGAGGSVVSYTLFIEYVAPDSRGVWMLGLEGFWIVGTSLQCFVGWLCFGWIEDPNTAWRVAYGVLGAPLVVLVTAVCYLPESARFLVAAGNTGAAHANLRRCARINGRELPRGRLSEVAFPGAHRGGLRLFVSRLQVLGLVRTTLLLFFFWTATTFLYTSYVVLAGRILAGERSPGVCVRPVNAEPRMALHAHYFVDTFLAAAGELFGFVGGIIGIDRAGRRPMMAAFFFAVTVVNMCLIAASESHVGTVICVFILRACVYGALSVLAVYTPEVYPTHIRTGAYGLCMAVSRLGAVLAPLLVVRSVEDSAFNRTNFAMSAVSFVALLLTNGLSVETKRINLDFLSLGKNMQYRRTPTAAAGGAMSTIDETDDDDDDYSEAYAAAEPMLGEVDEQSYPSPGKDQI